MLEKTKLKKGKIPSDPLIVKSTSNAVSFSRKKVESIKKVKTTEIVETKKVASKNDIRMLQQERALLYPGSNVKEYLIKIKGYTEGQYEEFIKWVSVKEWDKVKEVVQNAATTLVAERHIDLVAEAEDLIIKSAKIGLTRIVQMFTKLEVSDTPQYVVITDPLTKKKKTVRKLTLRSVDISNLMLALKNGHEIFRKALGLSNEAEGLAQVIREIKDIAGNHVHFTNVNINKGPVAETPGQEKLKEIATNDYDGLFEMIEMKRQIRDKNNEDVIDVESEEVEDD